MQLDFVRNNRNHAPLFAYVADFAKRIVEARFLRREGDDLGQ
jgi:hypothetical protein